MTDVADVTTEADTGVTEGCSSDLYEKVLGDKFMEFVRA
jgi:hypothetical protein